jgi:hypothetical protein
MEARLADNEQGLVRFQDFRLMSQLQWPPMPALPASAAAAGRNVQPIEVVMARHPPSRTSIGLAPVVERL